MAQTGESVRLILRNARITTMDPALPEAQALAVSGAHIAAVGREADVMKVWQERPD